MRLAHRLGLSILRRMRNGREVPKEQPLEAARPPGGGGGGGGVPPPAGGRPGLSGRAAARGGLGTLGAVGGARAARSRAAGGSAAAALRAVTGSASNSCGAIFVWTTWEGLLFINWSFRQHLHAQIIIHCRSRAFKDKRQPRREGRAVTGDRTSCESRRVQTRTPGSVPGTTEDSKSPWGSLFICR